MVPKEPNKSNRLPTYDEVRVAEGGYPKGLYDLIIQVAKMIEDDADRTKKSKVDNKFKK